VATTTRDQSLKGLFADLINDVSRLLRSELRLMQAEGHEKAAQIRHGAISIVSGLLASFCALLILLQAIVIALSKVVQPWLASLIVGVVVAIVGAALVAAGERNLRAQSLMPERTLKSLRDTGEAVGEKIR
jgi:hypothetical protein